MLHGGVYGGEDAPSLLRRDEDCGLVGLSIATVVYQLHLSRRLFECLCVTRFSKTATMHLFHLAFGMAYYVLVPLTLAVQLFSAILKSPFFISIDDVLSVSSIN